MTKPLIKRASPNAKVTINHTRSYQNSLLRLMYRHTTPIDIVTILVINNFFDCMTQFEIRLVNGLTNITIDKIKKKKK